MIRTHTSRESDQVVELLNTALHGLRLGLQATKRDSELFNTVLEELNGIAQEYRSVSHQNREGKSQTEVLVDVLSNSDKPLTVGELSSRTGFPASGVRALLYTNEERFEPSKMSPRRVVWRTKLTQPNRFEEPV